MKFPRQILVCSMVFACLFAFLMINGLSLETATAEDAGLPDDVMDSTVPAASESATKPAPPPKVEKAKATPAPAAKPKEKTAATKPPTEPTKKASAKKEKKPVATADSAPAASTEKPSSSEVVKPVDTAAPATAQSTELKALKDVDRRYQNAKSVSMDVEKTLVMGLIGKEKRSKGRLILAKGKMRMEIDEPEKSLVVIDGKTIWVADYPPAEFKNAAVQVMKSDMGSKKGAQQSLVSLLTSGGVLKHFKVAGVQKDDKGRSVYFLQPAKQSFEFKRAQLTVGAENKEIVEFRFWDERDNETRMNFSNVKFDGAIEAKTFQFTPPENADVSSI